LLLEVVRAVRLQRLQRAHLLVVGVVAQEVVQLKFIQRHLCQAHNHTLWAVLGHHHHLAWLPLQLFLQLLELREQPHQLLRVLVVMAGQEELVLLEI
jgi:hypothetical protein